MAAKSGGHNLSRLPPKPKEVKVATDPNSYRSRPTLPGPFGDEEPPFYGTRQEVQERAAVDAEAGMSPVVEYRLPGTSWMTYRQPVTVEDLAHLGLARQGERGWIISAEGQRMIYDAMGVPGGTER